MKVCDVFALAGVFTGKLLFVVNEKTIAVNLSKGRC
jgi:hypothetical protein